MPIDDAASPVSSWCGTSRKRESLLVQLVNNATIITTIADVDLLRTGPGGNEIQASGSIQVDFGKSWRSVNPTRRRVAVHARRFGGGSRVRCTVHQTETPALSGPLNLRSLSVSAPPRHDQRRTAFHGQRR